MAEASEKKSEQEPNKASNVSPKKKGGGASDAAASEAPKQTLRERESPANIIKFTGLIVFFVLIAMIIAFLWPYIGDIFKEGGVERLITNVRNAGWAGVFIVLGMQFLQIIVAFIPGEVVQIAAGMIYGPWVGALIILIGCVLSSAFVFLLVKNLGRPFVHAMVPEKYMNKVDEFERSNKLTNLVFVLFVIPGMPKDVFTYLVPLTRMKFTTFLLVTNLARIPGIVVSTYAADGLVEGRVFESVVIFIIVAAIALAAILIYEKKLKK